MNSEPTSDNALMVRSEVLMARNCCADNPMARMVARQAASPLMGLGEGGQYLTGVARPELFPRCTHAEQWYVGVWVRRGGGSWPPRFLAMQAGGLQEVLFNAEVAVRGACI